MIQLVTCLEILATIKKLATSQKMEAETYVSKRAGLQICCHERYVCP